MNTEPDVHKISQTIDSNANERSQTAKLRQTQGEIIPGQFIVVLKDNRTIPARSVADEARSQGAVVRHIYEHALKGFAIRVPNTQVLDRILNNPRVDYVQPDVKLKASTQTLPTGVNRADGDLSFALSGNGGGSVDVDIAVLDTGIDLTHPDLNLFRQITFVSGTTTGNDDDGHGTSVAGIAAAKDDSQGVVGMAPGARLWAIKVLDSNGEGFNSDIIAGVDYVTDNADEIDVVNLSFGGDGPDNALHTAISNSVAAGVTYAAAAGNENQDAASKVPASFPEVITVSAIVDTDGKCGGLGFSTTAGDDDTFADFSNFGSVVDIAAPGVILQTTARGGTYTSFSGTSASTPHVAGAAALYKSLHHGAAPSEVRNALLSSGSTASTVCDGKGHGYFTGDPDSSSEPLLYVGTFNSMDTTPPTLVSTDPPDGKTGVPTNTYVRATFSEPMLGSSFTTSTYTVRASGSSTDVAGLRWLASADSGRTAVFAPSSNLSPGTMYTVTATTGVKDLSGNAMTTPRTWSFNTGSSTGAASSMGSSIPFLSNVTNKTAISTKEGSDVTNITSSQQRHDTDLESVLKGNKTAVITHDDKPDAANATNENHVSNTNGILPKTLPTQKNEITTSRMISDDSNNDTDFLVKRTEEQAKMALKIAEQKLKSINGIPIKQKNNNSNPQERQINEKNTVENNPGNTRVPDKDSKHVTGLGNKNKHNFDNHSLETRHMINHRPNADAGPDKIVQEGTAVTLSGKRSDDSDGGELVFEWKQVSPEKYMINLDNVYSRELQFTAPSIDTKSVIFKFMLVASDNTGGKDTDIVIVTVMNTNDTLTDSALVTSQSKLMLR